MSTQIREVRLFEILMSTVLGVSVALQGWMVTTIISHGERLVAIESNRHTSDDARIAAAATAQEILSIWQEISSVREQLARTGTSAETIRWIERLERDIESHRHPGERP